MNHVLEEMLAYVRFDDADRQRLLALHAHLAPEFPAIAVRFYDAVFANPGAAAVLSGPAQIERLRNSLVDWMSTGLRGPHDTAFYDKRSRIGRRHVEIGLAQHYMFTAMTVIRSEYLARLPKYYPADEVLAVATSIDKLMDIELALMLRHYQLDSEERLVARERRIQADQIAALQTMTAGLAHEVRNPLNAAKLQLELLARRLRRRGEGEEAFVDTAELAHHEMERLSHLLDDFLSFARPPELHASEHDVVAIACHVLELERPLAERTGADLAFTGPAKSAPANVDPGKLHQVIQNLVRNALEAAPHGHVAVTIAVGERDVHLRVTDDGPGISEEVRRRIYEPFFSTKESGTGMGMSIVHNFVAMHGGTIDIASNDRGTAVDVHIPRVPR